MIITVKDTGIGIDLSVHQAIPGRFRKVELTYTPKYGGAGLGLAVAKSHAGVLSGTIFVDLFPVVGSTFTWEVPIVTASMQKRYGG